MANRTKDEKALRRFRRISEKGKVAELHPRVYSEKLQDEEVGDYVNELRKRLNCKD